jgi:thioesterase domain-containing protein
MEEIAQQYLREMILIQPGGPYLLAGHSFGGYVAIEIARELLRRGERVALLAMLDTYPPGRRRQASLPERIRIHIDNLRPLEPAQRRQYLRERLDQLILRLDRKRISTGARLADLSPSQRAVTYSRLARYTYDPAPYPGVLVLFQAQERPWYVRWDPMENWPKYVSGQLRIRPVPGRHESILFEPYVHDLAAALEKEIQLVLDRQSTKDPVS